MPQPLPRNPVQRCAGGWLRAGLALAALFATSAAPATAQAKARIRRLDGSTITGAKASAEARKALDEAHVTGAQLAVLNDGKLVWNEAFGSRDAAARLPMTADTVLPGASFTKAVFATYVMTLVDAGFIDLDLPVWQYLGKPLPQMEHYKDLAGDVRWRKITARHLLSHTSGLANYASLEPDRKLRIHWEPGSRYGYSGEGINLLQLAVEKRMGKPLAILMADRIFTPLGMTSTTLPPPAHAASSLQTTASDMAKFLDGLLAGRVISAKAQAELLRPQIDIATLHQFPTLSEEKGTEAPTVGLAYGLGWGLLTTTRYGRAFFKEGHDDGTRNYMICFPQRGGCMILLTVGDKGEAAFRPLLERILGDTVTPWEWEGYIPTPTHP